MPTSIDELNKEVLQRIWRATIEDALNELEQCPDQLHAICPRTEAQDFFESNIADNAFEVAYQEAGDERLRKLRSTLAPCKHRLERDRLKTLLSKFE